MSVQTRDDEAQSIIRADTPYPAMLLIGRLDAGAGGVASFDFTNIPAVYSKLIIDLYARGDTAATAANVLIQFNNDASAIYDGQLPYANTAFAFLATAGGTSSPIGVIAANNATAGIFDMTQIEIPAYANTHGQKVASGRGGWKQSATAANMFWMSSIVWYRSTNAINRITLTPAAGNFAQYSSARLYGVY